MNSLGKFHCSIFGGSSSSESERTNPPEGLGMSCDCFQSLHLLLLLRGLGMSSSDEPDNMRSIEHHLGPYLMGCIREVFERSWE